MKENRKWACDPANLKSTDGMTIDPYGNIYVADFSANAHRPHHPDGRVTRMACSPDTDGFHGELDEPGEPCVWGDQDHRLRFDLVTDEEKVNTAHEMPATMAMLDVEPLARNIKARPPQTGAAGFFDTRRGGALRGE